MRPSAVDTSTPGTGRPDPGDDGPDLVVVDWGTTSVRGYLVRSGAVLREARSDAGVGVLERADFPDRLAELLADLGADGGTVLVSGMAGSAGGWQEVPCVPLPANAGSLAGAVVRLSADVTTGRLAPFDVHLVPGVADVRDGRLHDLMRGEEVEFLGAAGSGTTVFPGSHSKWVHGRDGEITALRTYLTGEAFVALGRHTLLRRSVASDLRFGDEWLPDFVAGVDASADDLLHQLFAVRVRGLGGAGPPACAAWLSGVLVGAEVRAGLRWAGRPELVRVGGGADLQRLYSRALEHLGVAVELVAPHAAARGLADVARRMQQR